MPPRMPGWLVEATVGPRPSRFVYRAGSTEANGYRLGDGRRSNGRVNRKWRCSASTIGSVEAPAPHGGIPRSGRDGMPLDADTMMPRSRTLGCGGTIRRPATKGQRRDASGGIGRRGPSARCPRARMLSEGIVYSAGSPSHPRRLLTSSLARALVGMGRAARSRRRPDRAATLRGHRLIVEGVVGTFDTGT